MNIQREIDKRVNAKHQQDLIQYEGGYADASRQEHMAAHHTY